MKKLSIYIVAIFALVCIAHAGDLKLTGIAHGADVTLAWDANAESTLAGYRIHWTDQTPAIPYANLIDVGNVLTHEIADLTIGTTYFFAVTAYDDGAGGTVNESVYSNILMYTPPPPRIVIQVPAQVKEFIIKF